MSLQIKLNLENYCTPQVAVMNPLKLTCAPSCGLAQFVGKLQQYRS